MDSVWIVAQHLSYSGGGGMVPGMRRIRLAVAGDAVHDHHQHLHDDESGEGAQPEERYTAYTLLAAEKFSVPRESSQYRR